MAEKVSIEKLVVSVVWSKKNRLQAELCVKKLCRKVDRKWASSINNHHERKQTEW